MSSVWTVCPGDMTGCEQYLGHVTPCWEGAIALQGHTRQVPAICRTTGLECQEQTFLASLDNGMVTVDRLGVSTAYKENSSRCSY